MGEINFYEEFCVKLSNYLQAYLSQDIVIAYSFNKSLDKMLQELSEKLDMKIDFGEQYVPKLKLDILFGFQRGDSISLVLVEAKYLRQLSLKDFSQLVGYLQVAKNISLGILLLIVKGTSPNKLSNDFNEIISLNQLPMDWTQLESVSNQENKFKTGIMCYHPNSTIDWIDTTNLNGISSFEEFVEEITMPLI